MERRRRALESGTVLSGQYRIEGRIGSGGFAITYKATQLSNGVTVAIKELFPINRTLEMEHEKERFPTEAKILREFDYLEGIVSVRNVFEEGETAYLVMDYIEGLTLKDYVEQYGSFSWDELVKMVTPIMKSLTKIHRRNVIHCDISPDNLIIGMDNKLWLVDFGATQRADVQENGTVIFKQGYAPMEQYCSDRSESDGRLGAWTDVYALAATMYMALTGKRPDCAPDRMRTDPQILRQREIEPLRGLRDWQAEALMKAMAVQKSDRYAAMDEFFEAVCFEPEEPSRVTRIVRRKPEGEGRALWQRRSLRIAGLILLLVLAGLWVYGQRAQIAERKQMAEEQLLIQPSETGSVSYGERDASVTGNGMVQGSGNETGARNSQEKPEAQDVQSEVGAVRNQSETEVQDGVTAAGKQDEPSETGIREGGAQDGQTEGAGNGTWKNAESSVRKEGNNSPGNSQTSGKEEKNKDSRQESDDDDLY